MITVVNSQRDLPISTPHVKKAVSFLLKFLKISTHELIIHFVTEKKICQIHKDFFNDPTSTDCITFPIDSHTLGEVFICPKTAQVYAKEHAIHPQEELYRYVIHCLLHLIGYDDIQPQDRAKMRRKENACLKKLGEAGFFKKNRLN